MRRIIFLIIPLIFLCSCTPKGSAGITMNTASYQTDTSDISVQGFEISDMKNTEFQDTINENISTDIDGAIVSFDTLASASSDNLHSGNKCVFTITQDVKYNENNFLSIIEEHYVYLGGAHGNSMRFVRNIDLASAQCIHLCDLFSDSGYENTLNRMIDELVEKYPEKYSGLWETPQIKPQHQTDFYINDDRLVIFFQPYDLSYYARGYVEFPLRLKDLDGYLKDEYKRLVPK